jgi:hypothetical protein
VKRQLQNSVFEPEPDTKKTQKLKLQSSDEKFIPYLQMRPFHVKYSNQGKMGDLEKEVFKEIVSIKKKQLKEKSNMIFRSQKVEVIGLYLNVTASRWRIF